MPAPVFKRYEQILQAMINGVVSRTTLTDITDSSIFKHTLAAHARELDEVYFQMGLLQDTFSLDTAAGQDMDDRAAQVSPALITRVPATRSIGQVTFSRTGTSGTVTIPAGTVVQTASAVQFATSVAATILDTATTATPVDAVAQLPGAAGNVAANSVTRFGSKPVGVDAVTNGSTFNGGADSEADDVFRARIRAFIASLARGTTEALEFVATNVALSDGRRVRSAHVFEDPDNRGEVVLYVDDGAGTAETVVEVTNENVTAGLAGPPADSAVGGEVYLHLAQKPVKVGPAVTLSSSSRGALTAGTHYTLDDASGQLVFTPALAAAEVITATTYTAYTGLIAEVQKVVDGDSADRTLYPGWRAAGVRVRVRAPTVLQQIVVGILVTQGVVKADAITAAKQVVAEYINNLGISGDVVRAELIQRVMGVTGVVNCVLATPAADVTLLDDQLARALDANITFT